MKCMCVQTRPWFILSSEGVFGGMEFEPMLTPREKSPLPENFPRGGRTFDALDSKPKHYQRAIPAPTDLLTLLLPAISLGFTILLLTLLPSQLYLWGSPSSYSSVASYISGVHHSSSYPSAFPAISLGFTFFLLFCCQLYLWGSPFFFSFFFVPSYISGVHHFG